MLSILFLPENTLLLYRWFVSITSHHRVIRKTSLSKKTKNIPSAPIFLTALSKSLFTVQDNLYFMERRPTFEEWLSDQNPDQDQNVAILLFYLNGATREETGKHFSVSANRITQILDRTTKRIPPVQEDFLPYRNDEESKRKKKDPYVFRFLRLRYGMTFLSHKES